MPFINTYKRQFIMLFKNAVTAELECIRKPVAYFRGRAVRKHAGLLASLSLASLLSLGHSTDALAATAPPLGSATNFAIVSNTFTNSGNPTVINGSVCYTTPPSTVPTTVTGVVKTPCDTEIADQGIALANLDSQLGACTSLGGTVDLSSFVVGGGTAGVYPPGCYSSTGAMSVGSTISLNGAGVYVFRPGAGATTAALNTAANSIVTLNGGACAGNVFWAPTAATTLGANSTFVGTVIGAAGMTMGMGSSLSGRALTAGGTATTNANTISVPSACAPPNQPSLTVTKVSNGGVGTFNFSGSNGFTNQSITTVTPGSGVTGATQTLAAAGVSTTLTEATPPTGYSLASISCSGLGAGGTQTPNIGARTVTLDAAATAAGAAIACTFTNNLAGVILPSITLTKVSNGGVGTFNFSGSNGFTNQSITTVTPGSGVAGVTQTLTAAGVSTTLTEATPPAGYSLASISCSGLGAGGTQTPNIGARTVTLDAAATSAGTAIACTFTNNLAGFVPPVANIPTLSEWAMIFLAGLMAIAGFTAIRRKGMQTK